MSLQFAQPTVGSQIRVTTRYKNHVLYIPGEYVEKTYVGTVGSAHKFLAQNSFVLNTSNTPEFPRREIHLGNVINMEYLDGTTASKQQVSSDKIWTIKGSKGDVYTVTRSNNQLSCSCVGFQFRKKCKHVTEVK